MISNTVLYLSQKDVEAVNLPMPEIIDALEDMFKEKGEGRVEMPPKPGIHTWRMHSSMPRPPIYQNLNLPGGNGVRNSTSIVICGIFMLYHLHSVLI